MSVSKEKKPKTLLSKLSWLSKRVEEARKRQHPPGMSALGAEFVTKWYKNNAGLNQIYSTGLEFAFFNQVGQQCHEFAFCKDYLQDAVWATVNKTKSQIYGFSYTYKKNPPLDLDNMRLGVRCNTVTDLEKKCENSLKFLQEVDKEQGFEPSTLLLGGKRKGESNKTFVFVSDKAWMHSSVMVSLYALLVRVGMTYTGGGWLKHFDNASSYFGRNDKSYTKSAKKGLTKLMGTPPSKLFAKKFEDNYPKEATVGVMHNSSGIVAYSKGTIGDALLTSWKK